jgi:ABC-2 type transport system permease protein
VTKSSDLNSVKMGESRPFFVDHLLRDKLEPSIRQRVVTPYEPVIVNVGADGRSSQDPLSVVLNTMAGYFFGLLLVITIFTSSTYLLRSVSEEKTSRIIEIILSSVTPHDLLAGKVLGLGALGLTQVLVWLASAFALGRAAEAMLDISLPFTARPEIFVMGVVYYLLGFLVYAVLTGSVGALGTTMQESQQLAGIFSMMAAVPLMLGGMVIAKPDSTLFRVLSWFPIKAPTMMLLRFPMSDVPLLDVVGSIATLVVTIPVVLVGGARLFRAGLLMYGKRPTVRQMLRALKEA